MFGLGGCLRVDAAHEIEEPPNRLSFRRLGLPEPIEGAAIGAIGVGEFDNHWRIIWSDRERLGRVDGVKAAACQLLLRKGGQIDAGTIVDRCEQDMFAFRRIIEDPASSVGLIDWPLDGGGPEILEAQISEILPEAFFGLARGLGKQGGVVLFCGKRGCPCEVDGHADGKRAQGKRYMSHGRPPVAGRGCRVPRKRSRKTPMPSGTRLPRPL